jgi:hypothetical protein
VKTAARLLAVAALFVACITCWSGMESRAQEKDEKGKFAAGLPPLPKWEYKVVAMDKGDSDVEKELNKLGDEGWELAGAPSIVTSPFNPNGAGAVSTKVKLIFKRPKR